MLVEVAELVVLLAARVDLDEREAVPRRGVLPGDDLVVGDPEVRTVGEPTLDLNAIGRTGGWVSGEDVVAGVIECLLDGLAAGPPSAHSPTVSSAVNVCVTLAAILPALRGALCGPTSLRHLRLGVHVAERPE